MPNNNYFYHHGIDGQKWGKRNGPPYPLNRDSIGRVIKRRENKDNAKQRPTNVQAMSIPEAKSRAIASGQVKNVNKYRVYMTDDEVEQAMNRIAWFAKLDSYSDSQTKSAFDKLDSLMKKVDTVGDWLEIMNKVYKALPDSVKNRKKN